jgi:nitroreductase
MDAAADRPALADWSLPVDGEKLHAALPSAESLAFLARRRSLVVKDMGPPGPDPVELDRLLAIACRVPDHGKLAPWRFVVVAGEARGRLGEVVARAFRKRQPDAAPTTIEIERGRFLRAPVVVAVVSDPTAHPKVPEWEQVLSAGAVCHQLLLAANAAGFAAQWLTEWYGYDRDVLAALGLVGGERLAGFIYIGSSDARPEERRRPDPATRVTRL